MQSIVKKEAYKDILTPRDRFKKVMEFQGVDRIPHYEFGYWDEVYGIWQKQGLPDYVNDEASANKYFGFDLFEKCPVNKGLKWLVPPFEYKILEEDESHQTIIDEDGVKCIINKNRTSTIPKFLKFPLENRKDWNQLKRRLDPQDPRRIPDNWDDLVAAYATRDYPLGINIGSLLGFIRDLMGFENTSIAFYDMPELMDEMIEYMCEFNISIIEKILPFIEFDYASGWEDIAFKNGPIISPAMFKKFLFPRYKRIAEVLNKYGVKIIFTDCDGNIMPIVEQWIEAGYTCQFPIEVASGTDPVILRKKYGKEVLLIGGVNKQALIKGEKAIDAELKRIDPIINQGGFIPHVDHRCPPDVTFKNYHYYLDQKKKILGF